MIMTFPLTRRLKYLNEWVEVPLWVKYLALDVRMRGNKADLIGFSHKPYLAVTHCNWFISKRKVETRQEIIGVSTSINSEYNDEKFHRHSLQRMPDL